ncbi:MAG: helix-turn-helix domain-containing protein [Thermodesulfobacteriota bacterium]
MSEKNITLGSYLRTERERRDISLEAIARATKITLKTLKALENSEFHLLPPPVFVRGFLRAYAHHVGLEEQKVLEMYERQTKDADLSGRIKNQEMEKKFPRWAKILVPILLIVCGVIVFYYLANIPPSPPSTPPPSSSALPPPSSPTPPPPADKVALQSEIKASPAVEEAPPPPITSSEEKRIAPPPSAPSLKGVPDVSEKTPPALSAEKKERRHVLRIKAIERTWLRLKPDDGKEIEALLKPKEEFTWKANRQFKITIGNAGGVEITFNGVRQGRLGESGQVVHLVLPPEIKEKQSGEEGEEKD